MTELTVRGAGGSKVAGSNFFHFRGAVETRHGLWGSWAQKSFCVPHFLFLGNGPCSATLTFLEFLEQVQTVADQGREEQSSNNSTALGQDPGFLSRNTHNNIGIFYT